MSKRKRTGAGNVLAGFAKGFGAAALVALAVVAVTVAIRSFTAKEKMVRQMGPLLSVAVQKIEEPADASSEIDGKYYGLCKKNSVKSVKDFRNTVRNDPVLAAHYAGFNWDAARIEKQGKDVWTYVSYRKGEEIRRTRKAVRLPRGDGYVTDGTRVVRTYCCNDYVLAPPPAVTDPAAPVERVDAPPRRPDKSIDELPPQPLDSPGAVPELHGNVPVLYSGPPLYYGNPPGNPPFNPYSSPKHNPPPNPPPPPTPVPEPGTILLVGLGAGMFGLFSLLRRKRNRP